MKKTSIEAMIRPDVATFRSLQKSPVVLVADNIRSMNNVGSFFRLADTFAIESILLVGISGCPPHPEIRKTALGAEESVAYRHSANGVEEVEDYKRRGYKIIALEQTDESVPLQLLSGQMRLDCPCVIIAGNEVHGVSDALLALADCSVEIPQMGTKHSLNVSVAVGIALWEIMRDYLLK